MSTSKKYRDFLDVVRGKKRTTELDPVKPPSAPVICSLFPDVMEDHELEVPVFGQYPKGLIGKLVPYLGPRSRILHVCSGALPPGEGIRVDIRYEVKPDVIADGRNLPFPDGSFESMMIDPPYTPQYARELYGVDYPRPSHLLREAMRVLKPCGRVAFVHYITPERPKGSRHVKILGLSTGSDMPFRAISIFEKEQEELF